MLFEQEPGGPAKCTCPDCDYETDKERGVPCRSMECPECGATLVAGDVKETAMPHAEIGQIAKSAIEVGLAVANGSGEITTERATKVLRAWESELNELWQPGVPVADAASFQVDGRTVTMDELKEAYIQLQEVTKAVDGKPRPAGDFLVVEDPSKPNTWHLPVKVNGKPDHRLMGGAWAALHGGYRGQTYQGPDKAKAISKLKALYKAEGMETPGGQQEVEFDMDKVRDLLAEALEMLNASDDTVESDGHAVEFARDATDEDTATLTESETAVIEAGRRAPVVVDFQILQPGPGNKKNNNYYPAEVVERDIHVFSGVDVFATDHKEKERSERTKVGKVLTCPARFTESGAPVAPVLIYDPDQAEKARNRADANALDTLECSIFGSGKAKKGRVDGKEYKIVESITHGRYLELVSKAGAGGRALNLAESDPGGDNMSEEQADATPVEEVEEVEIEEANAEVAEQEQEPQMLGKEAISEALGKTNLPEFVKATLSERQYESGEALKEAIASAVAEVKKLTGSGNISDLGESESVDDELQSLEESEQRRKDRFNEIMQEVGLREV